MPLYRWVRDEVERYTFIKRTVLKNGTIYFYYDKDNEEKSKRLPYRASKEQLLSVIDKIKKEIDYDVEKAIRDHKVRKAIADEEKKRASFSF